MLYNDISENQAEFAEADSEQEDSPRGHSKIFVWGNDEHGQLGIGTEKGVQSNSRGFCIPRQCKFEVEIASVSCGASHSVFATIKGHIYTMGNNREGQLGTGDCSQEYSS